MKASITLAALAALALFGLTVAVEAKLTPGETLATATSFEDATVNSGPSGAMLESSYFTAPQAPFAANRTFPCRLQTTLFTKTRLAQACN